MKPRLPLTLLLLLAAIVSSTCLSAQSGQALNLNGTDGYMRVADDDELDIGEGESFTLTLWVRTTATATSYRILSKRPGTAGSDPGYEMITQPSAGAYGINLRSAQGVNAGPRFGSTSITDGDWHHLAMVINAANSTATIYVDGVQEQQSNNAVIGTHSFANAADLLIGADNAESVFFSGLLDDIRIWSTALSTEDIAADATLTVDGSEDNLIAAWNFEQVSDMTVPDLTGAHPGILIAGAITVDPTASMIVSSADLVQRTIPVGMGASDEGIVAVDVATVGAQDPLELTALTFNLNGTTDTDDVTELKVYYTGSSQRFDTTNLLGSTSTTAGELTITGTQPLSEGSNYFWIAADVAADAEEGNLLDAEGVSITVNDDVVALTTTTQPGARLILIEHELLFTGGELGAVNWRIPAITTAADGSLVAVADARRDRPGDLPNHIDPVARRSTDNGATWSDPITIADFGGTIGAGDVAIITDQITGDIIAIFPSHRGFFQSTVSDRIRTQLVRSTDNGLTWSDPVEITGMVNLPSWSGAFPSSGSMNQTRDGRIIHSMVVRPDPSNNIDVYMIYSDDSGVTWNVKPNPVSLTGNESKVVELDNGDLMFNLRHNGGSRQIAISEDGGDTWNTPYFQPELVSPGVNGDLIRYTSTLDGFDQSRLLFSVASHPNNRRNMTVFLSYDEGDSWGTSKVINPGPSGYSSLTVLEDGTIGCFYEVGEYEAYQLYFARFSLDWLSDGADSYEAPTSSNTPALINPVDLELSPNPTTGFAKLSFDLTERATVRATVIDNNGKVVRRLFEKVLQQGQQTETFNLADLPNGLYYIELMANDQRYLNKVVKTE